MHLHNSKMGNYDQPLKLNMKERKIKHYSSRHSILLVGEGDFSFSACLAEAFGTAANMTATSLDSKASLLIKYRNASRNLNKLESLGCTIIHGVDVRSMKNHPRLQHLKFDRIVFNFPHAGFIRKENNLRQIRLHQNVVRGFFENARAMRNFFGEIHVTHKTSHPFSAWEIVKLAGESYLRMVEEVPFQIWDYPGYINKRGDGARSDECFQVGACSTFKFKFDVLFRLGL